MPDFSELPVLTTAQMIEVDRLMVEEWHISLTQMMENAGRGLAELTRQFLGGSVRGKMIVVLCGTGNNGGGGMVAARHLHNWGAVVTLTVIGSISKLKQVPAQQMKIVRKLGMVTQSPDLEAADVIIDALIGYGLTGSPRLPIAEWIDSANVSQTPIIALDAPTGLNSTNGEPYNPSIKAVITLTLALPKVGLINPEAAPFVGKLYLADISVPPELYKSPSLNIHMASPFGKECIIEVN